MTIAARGAMPRDGRLETLTGPEVADVQCAPEGVDQRSRFSRSDPCALHRLFERLTLADFHGNRFRNRQSGGRTRARQGLGLENPCLCRRQRDRGLGLGRHRRLDPSRQQRHGHGRRGGQDVRREARWPSAGIELRHGFQGGGDAATRPETCRAGAPRRSARDQRNVIAA